MFDKVYLISLEHRKDRLEFFFNHIPDPWLLGNISIFKAIDGKKQKKVPDFWEKKRGAWGCYQSHLSVIETALNNNEQRIFILEDDAIFCDNFNYEYTLFMNNLPDNWEMIYLGGQHLKMPHQTIINNTVGIGTNINRTHAYGLQNDGIVKVYEWLTKIDMIQNHHIDHHYGRLHETQTILPYCPLKWLVGQNEGFSDIRKKIMSTKWWN